MSSLKVIPGPDGWPLIGNLLELGHETLLEKSYEYAETYGDIVMVKVFGRKNIFINSYELLEKALGGKYKSHLNDRPQMFIFDHFMSNRSASSSLDGNGHLHAELRSFVAKGVHALYRDQEKSLESRVMSEINNMMAKIEEYGDDEWEVIHMVGRSLSNQTAILLSGEPLADTDGDLFSELDETAMAFTNTKTNLILTQFPFVRFLSGTYRAYCQRFSNIKQRIKDKYYTKMEETFVPGHIRGYADILIDGQRQEREERKQEADVVFTDETIMATILESIVAGHKPIRCALSCILLCLLNHPEYQEKLQKEIDDVIGNRQPTLEDKVKCPLIQAVVMETKRLNINNPLGVPHLSNEHLDFEGYDLPKDSVIITNLWYICHDEKVWGDPWTFRPERFLDQSGQLLPQTDKLMKCWIPFGTGQRRCVGETYTLSKLFLYIASLLQRWTFIPIPDKCGSCDPRTDQFIRPGTLVEPVPFFCRVQERKIK